jgi:hypothetical protein
VSDVEALIEVGFAASLVGDSAAAKFAIAMREASN